MYIEMQAHIGKNHECTEKVIHMALQLGLEARIQIISGAVLVHLSTATVRVEDIPAELFHKLPGVAKIIPALSLGF